MNIIQGAFLLKTGLFLIFTAFIQLETLHAQYSYPQGVEYGGKVAEDFFDDGFGEMEETPTPSPAEAQQQIMLKYQQAQESSASVDSNTAAQTLFGGSAGASTNGYVPTTPRWGDVSSLSGDRIEDTYEMKMREELKKPLPKRSPFGDPFSEIQDSFKKKK